MGTFIPIPIPLQPSYYARQIEAVILAAISASPALKLAGSLGVSTLEIGYSQPGDSDHRDYGGKADLPAIWLQAWDEEESDGLTCGTEAFLFMLQIGVVTEDATATTARRANSDVLSAVTRFVRNHIRRNRQTWLEVDGVHGYVPDDATASKSRPEQDERTAVRFHSLAEIPIMLEQSIEGY